jgi:saccharopine dehydrogenase-like NADP-dependent oxidoreductase
VVGRTVTRGGSARSTSEPAARGAAELAEGRLAKPGVHPPEIAVDDPEAFLGLLDTEVAWLGP